MDGQAKRMCFQSGKSQVLYVMLKVEKISLLFDLFLFILTISSVHTYIMLLNVGRLASPQVKLVNRQLSKKIFH